MTDLKFVSTPVSKAFNNYNPYYMTSYFESGFEKSSFDRWRFLDQWKAYIWYISQNINFFNNAKWFLESNIISHQAGTLTYLDQSEANQIFDSFNDKELLNTDGFNSGFVYDYRQMDIERNGRYYFLSDLYYSNLNTLNMYNNFLFKFFESRLYFDKFIPVDVLDQLIVHTISYWSNIGVGFKYLSLFDNDFTGRRVPEDHNNYYADSYQVYPHRLICAWKCVVKGNFTIEDIPQAAKVDNFMEGYTLISTLNNDEYFSSYNKDHIYKANLIEIRLKELGVLPYETILN